MKNSYDLCYYKKEIKGNPLIRRFLYNIIRITSRRPAAGFFFTRIHFRRSFSCLSGMDCFRDTVIVRRPTVGTISNRPAAFRIHPLAGWVRNAESAYIITTALICTAGPAGEICRLAAPSLRRDAFADKSGRLIIVPTVRIPDTRQTTNRICSMRLRCSVPVEII